MATNQLQDTINYIQPFCRYMKANIGTSNMPIVGIASTVRNIILSAPFTWRFNRNSTTFSTTPGVQDYTVSISDFGFIEKATVTDTDGKIYEIKDVYNNQALSSSTTQARPTLIAASSDNGSGAYVFRLSAVPDKAYTISITYQKGPVKFAATTDSWAPVPDAFSDIYNNMCLGYYMDSCQDGRAAQYIARGVAGLLARATGLSSMDKALFAQSYMNFDMTKIIEQLKAQQGQQAQAVR